MRSKMIAAVAAAGFALTASAAIAAECTSPWGADDQIGAANRLSPAKALEASKLVTTGKSYRLGIAVDRDTPAFPPRSLAVTVLQPNQYGGATFGANKMSYNDDMFNGWLGIGTQIDGLGHLGTDGEYYNCNKSGDFVSVTGLKKMGIETIPPFVTRGVLIDIAKHKGVDAMKAGDIISADDIKAAAEAQGVTWGEGDIVILHTGWLSTLWSDPAAYGAGEPGIDADAARYLASTNVVAVGADTWGIEAVPFASDRYWEGHQVLLQQNGIFILETMDTREMIKDGVTEFMFVLGAPQLTGAVQAIINPIAIR